MRTRRASDEAGSERTCIVTGMKDVPDAMLRFALSPDGSVVPDVHRKLPGRGVWTRLSFATVQPGGFEAGVLPRVSRQGAGARLSGRDGRRAPRARRAAVAVDRQQSRPGRRRRIQGRCGDRDRPRRGADPGERRRSRWGGQTNERPSREARPGGWRHRARKSLYLAPIGFGIGEGKCDTCCAQTRRSEFGLSRKGGSFAPLPRERHGRGNQNRKRRRAGRRGRNAWQAGRIG